MDFSFEPEIYFLAPLAPQSANFLATKSAIFLLIE